MKKLPVGIQTLSEIINGGYIYVDKTEIIHRLMDSGKYYFLSRPRRFGKSLTLSTIKEIYSGNKQLFQGLWIENNWDWTRKNPVVHLAFNAVPYLTMGLESAIRHELRQQGKTHNIEFVETDISAMFTELLEKLSARDGKVVILIDEYDKPLIDYLEKDKLHIAKENRATLKAFYSIIKSADPYIEFLLITGVSKFSQVSIFSDLNHLLDITLGKQFADLTGYTQTELDVNFREHIIEANKEFEELTHEEFLEKIRIWYNGYSWDGKTRVYNPFSMLNFFSKKQFIDYWFKSGTPTFLLRLLEEKKFFKLDKLEVNIAVFDSYDLENLDITALLLQTGYLTVQNWDNRTGQITLDFPNREVEEAMQRQIIGTMLNREASGVQRPVLELETAFLKNNVERVVEIINSLLKDVPYLLIDAKDEHFYHALVHLHFRYLGIFMESEVHTSDGRMDAVVKTPERIFILEFKINKSGEKALQQIKDKGYADKFRTDGREIVGVGINFSSRKKGVNTWKSEIITND